MPTFTILQRLHGALLRYHRCMLSNFGDIKNDVIRKLGIATTDAYYSDAILDNWIQQGHRWATSFRKWPFTEGRVSTTFTGAEEWSFEGYKADSIRMLLIGGKRFQKLNYEDYLILREEEPASEERVFSDFGRLVIVNPDADASGTMTAYGQYVPVDIDITDLTATTVFTGGDEEGNEAISEKVIEFAKIREQQTQDALIHSQKAEAILNDLWKRCQDEQFAYHTHRSRGGMFKRINIIAGGVDDELIRRDQFLFG